MRLLKFSFGWDLVSRIYSRCSSNSKFEIANSFFRLYLGLLARIGFFSSSPEALNAGLKTLSKNQFGVEITLSFLPSSFAFSFKSFPSGKYLQGLITRKRSNSDGRNKESASMEIQNWRKTCLYRWYHWTLEYLASNLFVSQISLKITQPGRPKKLKTISYCLRQACIFVLFTSCCRYRGNSLCNWIQFSRHYLL